MNSVWILPLATFLITTFTCFRIFRRREKKLRKEFYNNSFSNETKHRAVEDFIAGLLAFEQQVFPSIGRSVLPYRVFFGALKELRDFVQKDQVLYSDPGVQERIHKAVGYNLQKRINWTLENIPRKKWCYHQELEYVLKMEKAFLEGAKDSSVVWFDGLFGINESFFTNRVVEAGLRDIFFAQYPVDYVNDRHRQEDPWEIGNGERIYNILMLDRRVRDAFVKKFERGKLNSEYRVLGVAAFQYLDFSSHVDVHRALKVKEIQSFVKEDLGADFQWFLETTEHHFAEVLLDRGRRVKNPPLLKEIDLSALNENNLVSQKRKSIVVVTVHSFDNMNFPGSYAGYPIEMFEGFSRKAVA